MKTSDSKEKDWNPAAYLGFQALRLRPALDLLAAVPELPVGDVVDLGCGAGTVGPALAARFRGHRLVGVDHSPAMLEQAALEPSYDKLETADAGSWQPDRRPALIFSNALLQWLPEHGWLLPRLVGELAAGGTLAVQMPRQYESAAFRLMRKLSAALFPDRFDWTNWEPPVARPEDYAALLTPLGELALWETTYYQRLDAVETGHPVRYFSQSTAARPILEHLSDVEATLFLSAFDNSLFEAYPSQPDGSFLYPFQRLFFTVTRTS